MAKSLTENDPIDFGKYKGKALKEIPAGYLLYCYHKDRVTPSVRQYIKHNYMKLWKQEQDEKNQKSKRPPTDS